RPHRPCREELRAARLPRGRRRAPARRDRRGDDRRVGRRRRRTHHQAVHGLMAITIDHTGKVALVTGAGAGMGREIARWMARAGAAVAVNDLRARHAGTGVGWSDAEDGRATAGVADCRADAEVDVMVRENVACLGGLDFAVNNIGMLPAGRTVKPFVEYRGDDWRDVVDQNLTLAALSARAEAEVMLEQG